MRDKASNNAVSDHAIVYEDRKADCAAAGEFRGRQIGFEGKWASLSADFGELVVWVRRKHAVFA